MLLRNQYICKTHGHSVLSTSEQTLVLHSILHKSLSPLVFDTSVQILVTLLSKHQKNTRHSTSYLSASGFQLTISQLNGFWLNSVPVVRKVNLAKIHTVPIWLLNLHWIKMELCHFLNKPECKILLHKLNFYKRDTLKNNVIYPFNKQSCYEQYTFVCAVTHAEHILSPFIGTNIAVYSVNWSCL